MTQPKDDPDLARVADVTLGYYDRTAEDFRAGTMDHDVGQNTAALLDAIEGDSLLAKLMCCRTAIRQQRRFLEFLA